MQIGSDHIRYAEYSKLPQIPPALEHPMHGRPLRQLSDGVQIGQTGVLLHIEKSSNNRNQLFRVSSAEGGVGEQHQAVCC